MGGLAMAQPLLGKTVAVVGGDARQGEVVVHFMSLGARVQVAGLAWEERFEGALSCRGAAEVLDGAHVVILPVQGVRDDATVYSEPGITPVKLEEGSLRHLAPGAVFFVGLGSRYLRALCHLHGIRLIEFREADEFAIYNSIPSAEGAIQMAMEASRITLFGSACLVLGYGRTGRTLAQLLKGLGAHVTVAARGSLDQAKIYSMGLTPLAFDRLESGIGQADFVFNTVPAEVLTREVLQGARQSVVIIDLASAPGGTDWEAARELGLKALLAPGLPGKVAPVTAGRIIADTIVRYLDQTDSD